MYSKLRIERLGNKAQLPPTCHTPVRDISGANPKIASYSEPLKGESLVDNIYLAVKGNRVSELLELLQTGKLGDKVKSWILMLSARYGRVHFAQAMVEAGINPDHQDVNGNTALILASQYGHTNMVNYLVKIRCNSSLSNKIDREALHMACERGHADCAKILLTIVKDVDAPDGTKDSPIVLAARHGHHDVAKVLIDAKCNVDEPSEQDMNSRTPIHFAAVSGYDEFVDVLLQSGAKPDEPDDAGNTPLLLAATWGHVAVVKSLLKTGKVDVNWKNKLRLCSVITACAEGHYVILQHLLEAGADPNSENHMQDPAILVACQNGHGKCAEVLIEKGCDMNEYNDSHGRTALTWALDNVNDLNYLAKQMIEKGADINAGRTGLPLDAACKKENVEMVDLLLEKGVDVNKRLLPEKTIGLMFAIEKGNVEICKKLLDAGADANAHTIYKVSCLMLGADHACGEITKLLLENGADVNFQGFQGYSVMFSDEVDVVRELLAHGGDINVRDAAGNTPLIRAVTYSLDKITKFLIKNNADVNIRGMSFTACEQALIEESSFKCAKLLIKAGCDLNFLQRWERTCYPEWLEQKPDEIEWLKEQAKLPPSLAHCCRKSILNGLKMNIPQKIDELHLPSNLKDYLHYSDLDDEGSEEKDDDKEGDDDGDDKSSSSDDNNDDDDDANGGGDEEGGDDDDDDDSDDDADSDTNNTEEDMTEVMGYLQLIQQLQRLQQPDQ